jgi:hypothetical protein
LVYNASSFILPTLANITTAANDIAKFVSLGSGNWQCLSYTLANGTLLGVVPIVQGGTGKTTAVAGKDALTVASAPIASATTVDLSLATGEFVTVTGTNTIRSLGTAAAGVVRTVTFQDSGALVVHDVNSIILPGF